MEDDAGGMVRRLALKTRFSEMGWGSTPPSSANFLKGVVMSHDEEKVKHSKRIFETDNAVKKQVKIAKEFGVPIEEPHKFDV